MKVASTGEVAQLAISARQVAPGGQGGGSGSPIRWVNSDSSVWLTTDNVVCQNAGGNSQAWVEGTIAANLLGSTGMAVMGSSSPTIVSLTSLTATAARNTWIPIALAVAALVLVVTLAIVRRKQQA